LDRTEQRSITLTLSLPFSHSLSLSLTPISLSRTQKLVGETDAEKVKAFG